MQHLRDSAQRQEKRSPHPAWPYFLAVTKQQRLAEEGRLRTHGCGGQRDDAWVVGGGSLLCKQLTRVSPRHSCGPPKLTSSQPWGPKTKRRKNAGGIPLLEKQGTLVCVWCASELNAEKPWCRRKLAIATPIRCPSPS